MEVLPLSYSRTDSISRLGSMWLDNIPPINLISVGQLSMLNNHNPFARPHGIEAPPFNLKEGERAHPAASKIELIKLAHPSITMDTSMNATATVSGSINPPAPSTYANMDTAAILAHIRETHLKVSEMVRKQEEDEKALEQYLIQSLPPVIQMQWKVFRQNRQITRDLRSMAFLLPAPFDQTLRASPGAELFIEYQRLAFAKASPTEMAESLVKTAQGMHQ